MTTYRVPGRVAHVIPDDEADPPMKVFVMQLPDGPPVVLQDSAAWIWLLAAEGEENVVGAVAEMAGRPRDEIAADVTSFLDELVAQGLLTVDQP